MLASMILWASSAPTASLVTFDSIEVGLVGAGLKAHETRKPVKALSGYTLRLRPRLSYNHTRLEA